MFDLAHIWSKMSLPNKGITLFILGMAILTAAITGERILALGKSAKISRVFASLAAQKIQAWDTAGLRVLANSHKGSSLARLLGAITAKYDDLSDRGESGAAAVTMIRNEATRQQEAIGADMRKGMSILATVGSITPFVGLLGTVIGIIAAFQAIGAAGAGGLGTVSAAIGEALVETAIGLMVAIPAVIAFNYLTARVASVEAALARSAGQLIDEMELRLNKIAKQPVAATIEDEINEPRQSDSYVVREAA